MKPTIPYIEQKFEEFNEQMFAGRLPKLPIELSDAKTFIGVCVYKKRKLPNGKFEKYDFKLRINTRIDLSEQEIEDTIIHEMIHYYIDVNQLEDSSSHGHLFRQMMNAINDKFGRHLSVTHKGTQEQREQAIDKTARYHVIAVVKLRNGKCGIKVLPRIVPRILNYYNKVGASKDVLEIELYMSNNIFFNRFPNSSALTVYHLSADEIAENLKGAEKMECDGKSIIRKK